MKNLRIIFIISFLQFLLCCNHPHPKACFTVNKSTAYVGDTIKFTNCTDYDGGNTQTDWHLGDTQIINNGENVQRVYKIAKQYVVSIDAGGRSYGDTFTQQITIK